MKTLSADEEALLRGGTQVGAVDVNSSAGAALLSLMKRGLVIEHSSPIPGVSIVVGNEPMIRLALRCQDAIRRLSTEGPRTP